MEMLYYLAAKYSFTAPPCVDSYIYKKDFLLLHLNHRIIQQLYVR